MKLRNLHLFLISALLIGGQSLLAPPAHAYSMPDSISVMEWDAWPRLCKAVPRHTVPVPQNRSRPPMSEAETRMNRQLGFWHFCAGYIWLMRSELAVDPERSKALMQKGLGDIYYVQRQLKPKHPLTPMVHAALARALRQVGEVDKAIELLDKTRKHHPGHAPLYTVQSAIYFDQQDYPKAVEILELGNQATGDRSAQLQYYLGLAYYRNEQIELAREYERKAREGGFPLRYLARKLAEHAARPADGSQ